MLRGEAGAGPDGTGRDPAYASTSPRVRSRYITLFSEMPMSVIDLVYAPETVDKKLIGCSRVVNRIDMHLFHV